MSGPLNQARNLVLDWLRASGHEPGFLAGVEEAACELRHDEIAQRFLALAEKAGFSYEVIDVRIGGQTAYVLHWTHRGASFVGFKQPPHEAKLEDAMLAGCAALLENQWCLQWLQE